MNVSSVQPPTNDIFLCLLLWAPSRLAETLEEFSVAGQQEAESPHRNLTGSPPSLGLKCGGGG